MRLLILLMLVTTCQAQDLPPDASSMSGLHPVIFPPDQVLAASHALTVPVESWADQVAWLANVRIFLGNDTNLTNMSLAQA